jgi:hypothetical protein
MKSIGADAEPIEVLLVEDSPGDVAALFME